MPVPLLFIGIAAVSGIIGTASTAKAAVDNFNADEINTKANTDVDNAKKALEFQRENVSNALQQLGELKLYILTENMMDFVSELEKIKNVDFTSSVGLDELKKLHIDKEDFEELKDLSAFASQVTKGITSGITAGALTAFGAYSAATYLATASTGTAISTLSGAAATNATLAFFGGGSLAAGGLGMAGGMMILGGLVAGPALLVMGLVTGAKSQEKLNNALANKAEATKIVESLSTVSDQCSAIRRRTYMFYNLLAHLDTYFLQQVWNMKDIIEKEGIDYKKYSDESKRAIIAVASTAGSIKAVLDTAILSEDGSLSKESTEVMKMIDKIIYK